MVSTFFNENKIRQRIFIPFAKFKARAWLEKNHLIVKEHFSAEGVNIDVLWTEQQKIKFESIRLKKQI